MRLLMLIVLISITAGAMIAGAMTAGLARAGDPNPQLYADYAVLLERHLAEHTVGDEGLVSAFDYRAALDRPGTFELLGAQRERLAGFDPAVLDSREKAVAFWLNAYNFFMIAHILENPRRGELIDSVRDYGSLFNPYRVFRQDLFDVGGRKYSLSEIENDILLGEDFREKGWKEARVHFAVNCASVGCPPLRAEIYTADNLDRLLAENTRRSLATPIHLYVDGQTLYLTSLFDWYASDYLAEADSIVDFIHDHASPAVREKVEQTERIRFIDYDWALNTPENFAGFLAD